MTRRDGSARYLLAIVFITASSVMISRFEIQLVGWLGLATRSETTRSGRFGLYMTMVVALLISLGIAWRWLRASPVRQRSLSGLLMLDVGLLMLLVQVMHVGVGLGYSRVPLRSTGVMDAVLSLLSYGLAGVGPVLNARWVRARSDSRRADTDLTDCGCGSREMSEGPRSIAIGAPRLSVRP